jgi:hypothetical protein
LRAENFSGRSSRFAYQIFAAPPLAVG